MSIKNLLLAGGTLAALAVSPAPAADTVARPSGSFDQVEADGLPATPEEQARRERQPRDMAPDTGYRSAQSEKPGDQHLTTPLPPTTGTEAKAVSLSQVDQPDRTLISAPVESKDGHRIGEVAQVTLDANGKASEVVLNDAAHTRVAAGQLAFDPERGVLITQLSPSDLAPARRTPPAAAPPHTPAPKQGVP